MAPQVLTPFPSRSIQVFSAAGMPRLFTRPLKAKQLPCAAQQFAHPRANKQFLAEKLTPYLLSLSIYSTIAKTAPAWHLRAIGCAIRMVYTRGN